MARPLPFNNNAEKTVLGAMMIDEVALATCVGDLGEADFFDADRKHKIIFQAITALVKKHIAVDVQTVADELLNTKELDNIGGVDYLMELTQNVVSLSNMDFYVRILKDHRILRELLITMDSVRKEYDEEEIDDITDFIARADSKIHEITQKRRISNFVKAEEIANIVEQELKIYSSQRKVTGIDTGYEKLNEITHGFQPGEMIILAARPSMGKTALALNIAMHAARRSDNDLPIAIFSLEMPANALVKRLISTDAGVSIDQIQTGTQFLAPRDKASVGQAIKNVGNANIYIDETAGIKLIDIIAKSRQLKGRLGKLGLIVVDYIGLITTGEKKIENRQVEVSNISRQLKELARELKVPILVVSQLSREVERRENRRPILSDLRESGSIEQDADVVLLLYRDDYYKDFGNTIKARSNIEKQKKEEIAKKQQTLLSQIGENVGLAELRIAKNRNGKTGVINLIFFASYGRFDTPDDDFEKKLRDIRKDEPLSEIED
jgi:replicative DNA helicase